MPSSIPLHRFYLTLLLLLCTSAWGEGLTYLSPKFPYRLDVTTGWAQVPDAVLVERKKLLPLDMQGVVFETAFHLRRLDPQQADDELSLPYIIAQPLGRVSQGLITENDFGSLVNKMRDVRKMPATQKRLDQMSPKGAKVLGDYIDLVSKAGIYTDKGARKFLIITDSPINQEQKLMTVIGGAFLPNGMFIQLSGYCAQGELQSFLPIFLGMLNSLRAT